VTESATVIRPGEGEVLNVGPSSIALKATGANTAGTMFLSDTTVAPGFPGPPPHVHDQLHDMFFVLEGSIKMRLGDEELDVGPGTFVCVPPGVVHTFSNPGDEPARLLNFNTPAGWENYMRDLAAAFDGGAPATPEEIGKIASRYDFRPV
jgi:mannose-6-phosphate isomerase-like protein (cupin superfamily)